MKKFLLSALAVVTVAALSITGTIAWLQDDASDVNVMTVGNVSIEQLEFQRKENAEDGTFSAELEPFKQGKPMLPYVLRDTNLSDEVTIGNFTATLNDYYYNYVDKIVTVKNTGKSDAYVRTLIALPTGGVEMTDSAGDNWLHWNTWGKNPETDKYEMDEYWDSFYNKNGLKNPAVIKINGLEYRVWEFVHTKKLAAGAIACPTLVGVFMDKRVNNDENGYYMDLNTNNKCDADEKRINIPVGEPVSVYVISQAVQTDGFANAYAALEAGFPKGANNENVADWFGGISNVKYVEAPEQKAQIEGNVEDLENGTDLIVDEKTDMLIYDTNEVNADGATVELNGTGSDAYGYLAFLPDAGEDVTVENLNVTGSGFVEVGHYGMGGGDYTVNKLKIENLKSTLANTDKDFTLGCAFMAFGDAVLNDCVITGTTAADGVLPVDLGCGQPWKGYTDDDGNNIETVVNGGKFGTVYCWSQSIVTINGANVDTLYTAPTNNGSVTIKAGTNVGTINMNYSNLSSASANNLKKLVIEDGATVGSIVFNGNSYTVAEWNAYVASL